MKKQSAITLVALIITIIILLILATVSISLVINSGIINRAKHSVDTYSESELEEKLKFAFSEAQMLQYTGENNSAENSLKEIFENIYGKDNVIVSKAGKNYKVKVNNSKTAYRIKPDGSYEQYEEMDPTSVYARLDDDGTLFLRATKIDDRYKQYTSNASIKSDWNSEGNATTSSVIKIIIEEPIAPTSTSYYFYNFFNVEEIENIDNFHTENINYMDAMFCHCEKMKTIGVNKFDTSNVISMCKMFDYCLSLEKIDVSGFDTKKCKNMSLMFIGCRKLQSLDINVFCTDNVENMKQMFSGCSSLKEIDVSNFNTRKVINMAHMFYGCSSITSIDLSNLITENVTDINHMFWRM